MINYILIILCLFISNSFLFFYNSLGLSLNSTILLNSILPIFSLHVNKWKIKKSKLMNKYNGWLNLSARYTYVRNTQRSMGHESRAKLPQCRENKPFILFNCDIRMKVNRCCKFMHVTIISICMYRKAVRVKSIDVVVKVAFKRIHLCTIFITSL